MEVIELYHKTCNKFYRVGIDTFPVSVKLIVVLQNAPWQHGAVLFPQNLALNILHVDYCISFKFKLPGYRLPGCVNSNAHTQILEAL